MPFVQETTDFVENLILNHDFLKSEAQKEIRNASTKQEASDNIKVRFDTWFMGAIANVKLDSNGNPVSTEADATMQNFIQLSLSYCDWFSLVDKYWNQVRGS